MPNLIDPAAERFALAHTTPFTGTTDEAARWTAAHTPAPQMMAGLAEARLLEALVAISRAKRVLEVGTFTGVGALSLAAALPPDGRVVTLEVDAGNASIAKRHIAASPFADRIEVIVGDAKETLAHLDGPFDLVWIDAWKADYPVYYDLVVDKLSPQGILAADNLFRNGAVLAPDADDEGTNAVREFARRVHEDPRVDNVLLTIGDGVMLAWRRPDSAG